jgi:hypothetical protein
MNIKRFIALLLLICAASFGASRAWAATVDTALTHSAAMNRDLKAVVDKARRLYTHQKNTR